MATQTSKLQLLIELKNKLKMGLDGAKQQVDRATGGMQRKLDAFKANTIRHFADLKSEIPELGRAWNILTNPITAIAGGVALIGIKAREAIAEAERFSYGFRELSMLNIDKSVKDMGRLKSMIRQTSYEKGFDPTDTVKAFFDVQSTTGKYGAEVDKIVAKQGEFAQLMQADFSNWINGTAKAMANFGFGADKLDEFNRAAFATVKTGVTTFDELAKVQSVYAGAAASAKQEFASANKLFSIFTVKVKSADEAATLTKSLFNDLTKQTTIDAFKKIGINVFDSNGQFRQADKLLLELQKRFRELGTNDQRLIDLKNQFSGSEGLISFVQAATDKTNQLQATINSFDTAEFALPKALEIAKNDINYINKQLENRTKVLMAEVGENLLPLKNLWLEIQSGTLQGTSRLLTSGNTAAKQYQNKGASKVLSDFPGLNDPTKLSNEEFDNLMKNVQSSMKFYEDIASTNLKHRDPNWYARMFGGASQGFYNYQYASGALSALRQLSKEGRIARGNMPEGDFAGVDPLNPEGTNFETGEDSAKTTATNDLQSITRGSQTKNVTINIDSFIKSFTPTQEAINGMGKDQLERWLTDMFLRVVNSAEQTS
ncbi:MAG: phage tail tape measure protein [Mangrovibacterium sp.]